MIYFKRTDVSEETDVNKANASKECDICYYWYFLNFSFKFQPNIFVILLFQTLKLPIIAVLYYIIQRFRLYYMDDRLISKIKP